MKNHRIPDHTAFTVTCLIGLLAVCVLAADTASACGGGKSGSDKEKTASSGETK